MGPAALVIGAFVSRGFRGRQSKPANDRDMHGLSSLFCKVSELSHQGKWGRCRAASCDRLAWHLPCIDAKARSRLLGSGLRTQPENFRAVSPKALSVGVAKLLSSGQAAAQQIGQLK